MRGEKEGWRRAWDCPAGYNCRVKNWRITLAIAACGLAVAPAHAGQKASGAAPKAAAVASPFEPLDRWKAAVVAGDRGALGAFYPAMQGAFAQTPQGRITDPNEEPEFWSRLHSSGLVAFNPKILQMSTPQMGVVVLTLRIDVTLRQAGESREGIISASQVWVQQGGEWRIYRSQRGDPLPRPPIRLPEPARPNPQLYPDPSEAHKDLEAALAAARRDHKRVLVVFGGNWCYDCHVLDAAFHSKTIQPLLAANYHVVHVNVEDGTANTDLAKRCEVQPDKLPSLAVLDPDGRLVTSQRNGEFDNAVKIGMGDVSGFLERWKPAGRTVGTHPASAYPKPPSR